MATMICTSCCVEVAQNPRLKANQQYCGKVKCQRFRKAAWKRTKCSSSPEFRSDQALSNKKWAHAHPSYWREYRRRNPEKAKRNRELQRIRNRRIKSATPRDRCKGRRVNIDPDQLVGQFWLIPVIAKVDALKVNIAMINTT